MSEHLFPTYVVPDYPDERTWVVNYGMKHPSSMASTEDKMDALPRIVMCMYFILTTLSTVGYGDLHPYSIAEKGAGIVIQMMGIIAFSIVMNALI